MSVIRVSRGVWRDSEQVADLAGKAAALLSAAPDGTVIGGLTTARLRGFWLPDVLDQRGELLLRWDADPPEAHSHSVRSEIRSRRRRLFPDEIEFVDGLPMTTSARTWVDLGERLQLPDLVAAGDSVLRDGCSMEAITRVVDRAVHRRGIRRVRAALPHLNGRSRSRPESHLRYALVGVGLPPPGVNIPIHNTHGEWLAEPDLSFEDVKLALEYNGSDHAKLGRMRRDITRTVDMGLRGGWRTEFFGPAEVFTRPDQTAAYVRALYRERLRGH